ncbi:MAG: hypothetical protein ACJAT7_001647 [Psychromonas sp.]|jgi:hypothetical protein|uniref:hypothetical protein n=1 Tax=Psychromonas sp. TaxID=1884585 RepID=UPI0039E3D39D
MQIIEYLSKSYQHFLDDVSLLAKRRTRFLITLNGASPSALIAVTDDIERAAEKKVQLSTAIIDKQSESYTTNLFTEAKASQDILLFEKADLLFANKTALKRSHERDTGFDLNNLFKNIATHNGIVILAPEKMQTLGASMSTKVDVVIRFPSV